MQVFKIFKILIAVLVTANIAIIAFYLFQDIGIQDTTKQHKSAGIPIDFETEIGDDRSANYSYTSFQIKRAITSRNLAVIVNQSDPLSVRIAEYYQIQRNIPEENLIFVNFEAGNHTLSVEEFEALKATIELAISDSIQAYVLTWAAPYRVGCMSITSAFADGFDQTHCASGCIGTKDNPYFNSYSVNPYQDFNLRPTIALAAQNFEQAQQLIDRGVAADGAFPYKAAYFVSTSDKSRNVRSRFYLGALSRLRRSFFEGKIVQADSLENKTDVMFYFTGLADVPNVETNQFVPGAIADHLTSFGGLLTGSPQMSSLKWLEAGATGSYGAVYEPCNFVQKFPNPEIVVTHYLNGDTLLEAYWKSVQWPGQGIFIGEPLARPFGSDFSPQQ